MLVCTVSGYQISAPCTDNLYFQPAGLRPWEKSVVNPDSHDVHGGETGSDDTKRYFKRPLVVSALTFLQN